jgi:uncharacterized protein (TIGR04255 family)
VPEPYKAPPLVEAIFEVYYRDSPGASELSFKELEDLLRKQFSGRREELEPRGVQFQLGPGKNVAHKVLSEEQRIRLWAEDGGEMFQFAPRMCAYNILSRYRQFADHASDIERLFSAHLDRARPTAVEWAGQRYINKVLLPSADLDPAGYFEFYPKLPKAAPQRPFALQVVMERFAAGEVTLNLTYQGDEQEKAVYFLDIYARSTGPLGAAAGELRAWQEQAHESVRRAFESAVTAKARTLFGGAP